MRQIWLPESDAPQNGKGLLFEFPFGILNVTKGEKRLLAQESFVEASKVRLQWPRPKTIAERLWLAQECKRLLDDFPALTRKHLATQLGMTTARLNQILNLLRSASGEKLRNADSI